MLKVKTFLKHSGSHGIGLFADEFIAKGSIIFEEDDFTLTITDEQFNKMNSDQKQFIEHYAYKQFGIFKCSVDNDRFMNHSDDPNVDDTQYTDKSVASRDIQKGEEITCDYRVIKMKWQPE
jgi:SET domain-containing protein